MHDDPYLNDITVSKPILEMVTVANEFCYYLENAEEKSKSGILEFVNRILPLLYLKGSLLPDIEVENPDANEKFATEEQWERVFLLLREKFGKQDEFWTIDPLYINDTEPLKASLAENIADIYQDMKDLIMLYQKNTFDARQNAVADIKLLFATHWGYRIGNILNRTHHLLHSDEAEPPQFAKSLDLF
ncbi:MAG: hypothetical protein DRI72_08960 [Bacteroidetes bacterium]|nr:MAG: hypothetical protein DRI72_08960 [Bacteroidota bacterium]